MFLKFHNKIRLQKNLVPKIHRLILFFQTELIHLQKDLFSACPEKLKKMMCGPFFHITDEHKRICAIIISKLYIPYYHTYYRSAVILYFGIYVLTLRF